MGCQERSLWGTSTPQPRPGPDALVPGHCSVGGRGRRPCDWVQLLVLMLLQRHQSEQGRMLGRPWGTAWGRALRREGEGRGIGEQQQQVCQYGRRS
jgi:hypothetical protein